MEIRLLQGRRGSRAPDGSSDWRFARRPYQGSPIGDVTTLEWIRDRVALEAPEARRVDDDLRFLEAAAEAGELGAVADAAARLRETMAGLARPIPWPL